MQTMAGPNQRASSLVWAVMEFFLSKLVNQHTKRIIFVTSLYTRMSRLTQLEHSAISKLNQLMVLATNEESLTFTSRLNRIIWGRTDINDKLTPELLRGELSEELCQQLSTEVVDMYPRWLRYEKPNMIKDVSNLLRQSSLLRQSPQLAAA